MHRYVVISSELDDAAMQQAFSDVYPLREENAWVVATAMATSADVSNSLDFHAKEGGKSGIVVKIDQYYGCYDKALWQKLDAWKKA